MSPHPAPEPGSGRGAGAELLPELARLPGHLLWRAHARVLVAVGRHLPDGVDVHAYAVLLALADGRARSQQVLAEAIAVSRTTMTRVAGELADRGLVERVRNPDDRRSWALTRTVGGADAVRRWQRDVAGLEALLVGGLSDAEADELRGLLRAVVGDELPGDAPEALGESAGFLITRAHHRMHRDFQAVLAPLGIEPRHFGALLTLTVLGAVPQAELARRLGLSPASVVLVADDLQARGLVERRRLAGDRRAQLLHVRPATAAVVRRAGRLADRVADARLQPLDAEGRERLLDLLGRVVTGPDLR